jgi:hypothetical protein
VNNASVALNRVIPRFALDVKNVTDALNSVVRVVNPRQPLSRSIPRPRPELVRPYLERSIAVSLENRTVRGILNEIARKHGAMAWMAEYSNPDGSSSGLRIKFIGFDNWTVAETLISGL